MKEAYIEKYYGLKKFLVVFVVVMISQAIRSKASESAQPDDPPNIVLIMADDLGYSDLGCYGGEIETPNLDSLADNGLRFTEFYNAGRSWPTRASILTGYYPQQVNIDGERAAFPKWGSMIPSHLDEAGYRNYHSGKWHVPNVNEVTGRGGFDRSFNCTYTGSRHFTPKPENLYLDDKSFKELPDVTQGSDYYSTSAITDYSIQFLKQHQNQHAGTPFFLYTAFISPHFPLQAPQEVIDKYRSRYLEGWNKLKQERYKRQKELGFDLGENSPFEYMVTAPWSWPEQWLKDSIPGELRYAKPWYQLTEKEKHLHATKMAIHAAMVDVIDREVGRILDQLRAMGEAENTLVIFLSDNGASAEQIIRGDGHDPDAPLGSAGSYLCLGPGFSTASNTPLRRHKFWTHEGGINTPMIAHWPEGIEAKGEFRHGVGHVVDFLPTFLDLAGVEPLKERNGYEAPQMPGRSLVPLFKENKKWEREIYFSHGGNNALRQGKWKAVISSDIDGRWQLYNMQKDRTELTNLADDFYNFGDPSWKEKHQERLEQMKARWKELNELYQEQGKVGLDNEDE
ncbi:MAG: arylsulfatase [Bacteroidales bacterium]|nr:arylsulfatase [Bacteroidales bacterium]